MSPFIFSHDIVVKKLLCRISFVARKLISKVQSAKTELQSQRPCGEFTHIFLPVARIKCCRMLIHSFPCNFASSGVDCPWRLCSRIVKQELACFPNDCSAVPVTVIKRHAIDKSLWSPVISFAKVNHWKLSFIACAPVSIALFPLFLIISLVSSTNHFFSLVISVQRCLEMLLLLCALKITAPRICLLLPLLQDLEKFGRGDSLNPEEEDEEERKEEGGERNGGGLSVSYLILEIFRFCLDVRRKYQPAVGIRR